MLIQTKKDATPDIPWDNKQPLQHRIVFYFESRATPIWFYCQEVKKWWNYLRTQQLNKDNTEIYDNFQIYRQIYCIQIFEEFQKMVHAEALEIVEQKKKAARLSDNEIKILNQIQKNMVKYCLDRWKDKNHKVMEQLETNAQEEKKKQQQIEEAK